MKHKSILIIYCLSILSLASVGQNNSNNMDILSITQEWDKTFPQSDKVNHKKVNFSNRYGIKLVGDLYIPKNISGKIPAIAICGPYGAVKEQASGLYAQILAERGFITLAFDPSYSGESGGQPRYVSSAEIYTEDYSAAVDFLILQPNVDSEQIGILGICGFGGICINSAVQDTRIKATVSSTMGAFDSYNKEQRYELRLQLNNQRTSDLIARRTNQRTGGVPMNLPNDTPNFMKDYHDYYKTSRGFHPRSVNSNGGFEKIADLPFLTFSLLDHADEIRSAVLIIHGEKAYSLQASKDAFAKLIGDNKKLLIIPEANHTDLYDKIDIIPFDKIEQFYRYYLK